jgi:hypothetical protein
MNKTFTLHLKVAATAFIMVSLAFFSRTAYAQWVNNTTYIYYSAGNVGIGLTTAPLEKLQINGSVRGNISGALRISTGNGYIDLGPQNTSYAHIQTDRDKFFMNKPLYLSDGKLSTYNTSNLYLQTNSTNRLVILNSNGYVGIGTTNPTSMLTVNGAIKAERVDIITDVPTSDFVFEKDYNLMNLQDVEAYIRNNKHLPEVPSASEFSEKGYSVGQMDDLLLRKVEQLTLYIIAQNKRIEALENELKALK